LGIINGSGLALKNSLSDRLPVLKLGHCRYPAVVDRECGLLACVLFLLKQKQMHACMVLLKQNHASMLSVALFLHAQRSFVFA
jgi:hypothetical protein